MRGTDFQNDFAVNDVIVLNKSKEEAKAMKTGQTLRNRINRQLNAKNDDVGLQLLALGIYKTGNKFFFTFSSIVSILCCLAFSIKPQVLITTMLPSES